MQLRHQFGALLGAGFFQDGATRHDDVAARTVHLQDGEGLFLAHQRADVADRTDVHLRAGQEGAGAAQVDGEAALHAADDRAHDRLAFGVDAFQTGPGFFATGLFTADHGFAGGVLDALQVHFDSVADLGNRLTVPLLELLHRNAAFGLQTDVHNQEVLFHADHVTVDNRAFGQVAARQGLVEQRGEIVARGGHTHIVSHEDSGRWRPSRPALRSRSGTPLRVEGNRRWRGALGRRAEQLGT